MTEKGDKEQRASEKINYLFIIGILTIHYHLVYNMISSTSQTKPTQTLLILIALLLIEINAQLNCSNYYNQDNLPPQCNNNQCTFPTLNNASLIANGTADNQYILCIDLPNYNITVEAGFDLIDPSVYISGSSITF